MGVLFYYSMNINGCTSVVCVSLWRKTRYNLHTAPELCNSVWITVPFPVSSRWLSSGHLVGRREQPRDASSLPNFSSWHAPYHHKLPHSGENGTHTVRLPVSSRGPGLVKPLWPGETWQEAAGPAHDLRHSLWVPLRWHLNHLLVMTMHTFTSPPLLWDFWHIQVGPGG